MFRKIKGQDKAISILKQAVEEDKIAQAYLFYGPKGVGKFTTALYFAMAINCFAEDDMKPCGKCSSCQKFLKLSHPDLTYVFPSPFRKDDIDTNGNLKSDKNDEIYKEFLKNKIETPWKNFYFSSNIEIRIPFIRVLIHHLSLTANEARKKVVIVEDADMMNTNTANAFLKTLEEPPVDAVIILTTSKPNSLLPTVLSRCQKIPFYSVPRHLIEQELKESRFLDDVQAKMYARISNGNMEKALQLAEEGNLETRTATIDFLKIVLQQNDYEFLQFMSKYRTSKNQAELANLISYLIIWLSDISYFKYNPENMVNLDYDKLVEQLYLSNQNVDIYVPKLIEFLEKMLRKLDGHVNPQLIITEIYNRFCRTFQ
ncbi:MAG TPA: DNA polymerase III subunit delta' [Candidatus Cloacimonas sp.]|jgi:DNA polymerase-3 subunit delta'|nr:polymerase subunit delta [Candidatus Cloacimonadota bacterium]HCX73278.1 DNA polymerase III subunit delta' [Candidatus Cloacimonas sp.]